LNSCAVRQLAPAIPYGDGPCCSAKASRVKHLEKQRREDFGAGHRHRHPPNSSSPHIARTVTDAVLRAAGLKSRVSQVKRDAALQGSLAGSALAQSGTNKATTKTM
jgi:hypothetical protein